MQANAVLIFPPVPMQVMLGLSKANNEFSKSAFLMPVLVSFCKEKSRAKIVFDALTNAVNLVVMWNYCAGISTGL